MNGCDFQQAFVLLINSGLVFNMLPQWTLRCCTALLAFSIPLPLSNPLKTSAAETPNIVVILADDLGYGDLACYNPNSKIPTPHIDALAKQGSASVGGAV